MSASFPLLEVIGWLDRRRTATLATTNASGSPCAANVQFVAWGGLGLLWASSTEAEHSRNIDGDRRAAATVYEHDDDLDPGGLRGLQLRGFARRVGRHADLEVAYLRRFPFALDRRPVLDRPDHALYLFEPDWVRWIDNRRTPSRYEARVNSVGTKG